MTDKLLEYGASLYGTPLYLYDLDRLTREFHRIRDKLGERIGICYAMKANSFLTGPLSHLADRIEICSVGEYKICKRLGIPPEKMLISGVQKEEEALREILEETGGACVYTAESAKQYKILADWGEKQKKSVAVYLRLSSQTQFGMDREDIRHLLRSQALFPYAVAKRLHYFTGTQKRSLNAIQKELAMLDDFLLELEQETGCYLPRLEYGPGLSVDYFPDHPCSLITDEALGELRQMVESMAYRGHVTLEMGRALTALCGFYLTRVKELKINEGQPYCLVDGGIHQLHYDGQIRGLYTPYTTLLPRRAEGDTKEWTVCGSLCTFNDVLCQKLPLNSLKEGDLLVFERTGAYAATEGMALFLSHELPPVALYSSLNGFSLVREKQETYEWNMAKEDTKWKPYGIF